MEQQSYLTEIEFNPVLAGAGKRFLNYLIDVIIFYIIMFFLGFILGVMRSSLVYESNRLWLELLAVGIFLFYYFICELFLKGRTIGKFVTGTKVVNEDGTEVQSNAVLLRTLCRLVPFEPLSAFGGHPWHDKWTKTYVIDVNKTSLNNPSFQE